MQMQRRNAPLHRSPYGDIINEKGEVYAVIHQYDRSGWAVQHVRQTHPLYASKDWTDRA